MTARTPATRSRTSAAVGERRLAHRQHDEVRHQQAVGAEIAGHVLGRLGRPGDAERRVGGHRRRHGAAALEDGQRRPGTLDQRQRGGHVGVEGGSGHAAAAAAAADGRHAGEDRVLEAVGRRVPAGPRGGEQVGGIRARRARGTISGSGGPPRPMATTTTPPSRAIAPVEQAREVTGDGRLADALAGPDDVERRQRAQRQARRRVEGEVGAAVRGPGRQRGAHQQEALAVAEHRLVGEVDDDLGGGGADRAGDGGRHGGRVAGARVDRSDRGQAELGREARRAGVAGAQLLAAAGEQPAGDLVPVAQPVERRAHDRRVVLAVDDDEGARARPPGSRLAPPAARQMYFSNDAVEGANSISVSLPWNGYLRSTVTLSPSSVMTL